MGLMTWWAGYIDLITLLYFMQMSCHLYQHIWTKCYSICPWRLSKKVYGKCKSYKLYQFLDEQQTKWYLWSSATVDCIKELGLKGVLNLLPWYPQLISLPRSGYLLQYILAMTILCFTTLTNVSPCPIEMLCCDAWIQLTSSM